MSLGLGIFLSSLFLGFIYLFVATKDRWNWKKILIVWPILFVSIVLIVSIIDGVGTYVYKQYINIPEKYNSYLNIPLRASEEDLIFLKGNSFVYKRYDDNRDNIFYTYEIDRDNDHDHNIRIRKNKIWRISCNSEMSYDCPSINNLNINSTISEIEELLGKPDYEKSNDDNTKRIWAYDKYNTYMTLEKGKIITIGIYEPSLGAINYDNKLYEYLDIINFGDKNVTIKNVPLVDDEKEHQKNLEIVNDIYIESPKGEEYVWNEIIALKKKEQIETKRQQEKAREKALERINEEEENFKGQKESEAKETNVRLATKEEKQLLKWSSLKKGMAREQVKELVGAPVRIDGNFYTPKIFWFYSEDRRDGPYVYFTKNYNISEFEVAGWRKP